MTGYGAVACCCGGNPTTTCPQWTNCRPQEIWIAYSFSANYKQIVQPAATATGAGGILLEETESISGVIKFVRSTLPAYPEMLDYAGNWSYSKVTVQNRFKDWNDVAGPYCGGGCDKCVDIVPSSRTQTTGSDAWAVPSNSVSIPPLRQHAYIKCFQCIGPTGQVGLPRSRMVISHAANFAQTVTQYRCNGAVNYSTNSTLNGYYAGMQVYGRPQCLTSTAFDDYYIARDQFGPPNLILPVTYPYCRTMPQECDYGNSTQALYLETESIVDCYQDGCVQRPCYDPFPILAGGCGCSQVAGCPNPFPPDPPDNGCYREHLQYTMTSNVTVTNVIP